MYECVHNFQPVLCRLVDRGGGSKIVLGKVLIGTPHIPTEFV